MGKMKKEQDGSQQVEFLCMSDRTINVKLCRPIPSSLVINDRQLSKLELRLPVRCIQNQVYDNGIWLMLTDRAAISRSLFLHFFLLALCLVLLAYLSSQRKLYSIKSVKKRAPFSFFFSLPLSHYVYDKWDDNDKNEHIHSQIYLKSKWDFEHCIKYPFVIYICHYNR